MKALFVSRRYRLIGNSFFAALYFTRPARISLFICFTAKLPLVGLKIHWLSTSCNAVTILAVLDSSQPPVWLGGAPSCGFTHCDTSQLNALSRDWFVSDSATDSNQSEPKKNISKKQRQKGQKCSAKLVFPCKHPVSAITLTSLINPI